MMDDDNSLIGSLIKVKSGADVPIHITMEAARSKLYFIVSDSILYLEKIMKICNVTDFFCIIQCLIQLFESYLI